MIEGLIAGKIYGEPEMRRSQNGNQYVTAKVRAPTASGESIFVNVIAFEETPAGILANMAEGDAVSLAGSIAPKAWISSNGEARPSLDMQVSSVLTAYSVKRKRKAVERE